MNFNFDWNDYDLQHTSSQPTNIESIQQTEERFIDPLSISPSNGSSSTNLSSNNISINNGNNTKHSKHRSSVPSLSSAFSAFSVDQQSPITPSSSYFGHPFINLNNQSRHSISVVAPSDTFIKPAIDLIPPHENSQQFDQQQYQQYQQSINNSSDIKANEDYSFNIKIFNILKSLLLSDNRINFGEKTITVYVPQTAQKSYGTEKRYIAPPPQVTLLGKNWNPFNDESFENNTSQALGLNLGKSKPKVEVYLGNGIESLDCPIQWSTFDKHYNKPTSLPLTPPDSNSSSMKSEQFNENDLNEKSDEFNSKLMIGKSIARHLHINETNDQKRVINPITKILIPSFKNYNSMNITLPFPSINVISKASKQRKPKKNEDICVFNGSLISLYNRSRSQTSSTRYLTVTGIKPIWPTGSDHKLVNEDENSNEDNLKDATFTPNPTYWDPFIIWLYDSSQDESNPPPKVPETWPKPPPGVLGSNIMNESNCIRGNSIVVLQSLAHGVVSPPLVVRRAGKGTSVLGGNNVNDNNDNNHHHNKYYNYNSKQQLACESNCVLGEPIVQLNKIGLELARPSSITEGKFEGSGMYLTCMDELISLIIPPKSLNGIVQLYKKGSNNNNVRSENQEDEDEFDELINFNNKSRRTSYQYFDNFNDNDDFQPSRSRRSSYQSSSYSNGRNNKRRSSLQNLNYNNEDCSNSQHAENGASWLLDVGEVALWTISGADVYNHRLYTPQLTTNDIISQNLIRENKRISDFNLNNDNADDNVDDNEQPIAIPFIETWSKLESKLTRKLNMPAIKLLGKNLIDIDKGKILVYFNSIKRCHKKKEKLYGLGLTLEEQFNNDNNDNENNDNENNDNDNDNNIQIYCSPHVELISNNELLVGLPNQILLNNYKSDYFNVNLVVKSNLTVITTEITIQI